MRVIRRDTGVAGAYAGLLAGLCVCRGCSSEIQAHEPESFVLRNYKSYIVDVAKCAGLSLLWLLICHMNCLRKPRSLGRHWGSDK